MAAATYMPTLSVVRPLPPGDATVQDLPVPLSPVPPTVAQRPGPGLVVKSCGWPSKIMAALSWRGAETIAGRRALGWRCTASAGTAKPTTSRAPADTAVHRRRVGLDRFTGPGPPPAEWPRTHSTGKGANRRAARRVKPRSVVWILRSAAIKRDHGPRAVPPSSWRSSVEVWPDRSPSPSRYVSPMTTSTAARAIGTMRRRMAVMAGVLSGLSDGRAAGEDVYQQYRS